jgi:hypothetical protein
MNPTQIFEFARIWIYSENRKNINQMSLSRIRARPSCTVLMRPACTTVSMAHCCAASRTTAVAAAHDTRRSWAQCAQWRSMHAWRRGDFTDARGGRLCAWHGAYRHDVGRGRRWGVDDARARAVQWRPTREDGGEVRQSEHATAEERWARPARREDTAARRTYPSGGGEGDGGRDADTAWSGQRLYGSARTPGIHAETACWWVGPARRERGWQVGPRGIDFLK